MRLRLSIGSSRIMVPKSPTTGIAGSLNLDPTGGFNKLLILSLEAITRFSMLSNTLLSLLPFGEKVRMRGVQRSNINSYFYTNFLTLTLTLSQNWERGQVLHFSTPILTRRFPCYSHWHSRWFRALNDSPN
jgi:hypothetical protein